MEYFGLHSSFSQHSMAYLKYGTKHSYHSYFKKLESKYDKPTPILYNTAGHEFDSLIHSYFPST